MARPLRIEYNGAWYHIMNRGLARNPVFISDKSHEVFLDLLCEVNRRYQAEIHAYCLMYNHYHLLIRTPLGNISRIMRHIDGVYTQRFNSMLKRDGPLFRGRFKSILVEADLYLLRLTRYIHLNPVKAGLVKKPEHFKWSSYGAYLLGVEPDWLSTKYTLTYFDGPSKRLKYQKFVEEKIDEEVNEFYRELINFPVLGTDAFIKSIEETYLKEQHKIDDIPEHKYLYFQREQTISIEQVVSCVSSFYKISKSELCAPSKGKYNQPRSMVIYMASIVCQLTHSQISDYFKAISASAISKSCSRFELRLCKFELLREEFENIKKIVIDLSGVRT